MPIPETYTNNVGNLAKLLEAIRTAGVPERVTFEFLKTLGFKSSNDRSIISVLKGIGFLDASGTPTATYKAFRDPNSGPRVLATALRSAYSDIFLANTKAQDLPLDKLQGIVASKISKGQVVVNLIASNFKALAKLADFSESTDPALAPPSPEPFVSPRSSAEIPIDDALSVATGGRLAIAKTGLHYNIQIHLPTTTDVSVYNAIFKSLRDHLL